MKQIIAMLVTNHSPPTGAELPVWPPNHMSHDELDHKDKGLFKLSKEVHLKVIERFRKKSHKNLMQQKRW